MSVTGEFDIPRLTTLNESADLRGPLGQWDVAGIGIGDASGGVVSFLFTFSSGYVWSLEGWCPRASLAALGGVTFTYIPAPQGVSQGYTYASALAAFSTETRIIAPDGVLRLPLTGRNLHRADATVSVTFEVNADIALYRVNLWGHYWDRRSPILPGGLVRPG